jgi:hypothetical protein
MSLLRASVLSLPLLLAACAEPPRAAQPHLNSATPDFNCRDECAAGFHWAMERGFTDDSKCRGETETARGCREAVALMHPLNKP